ncbi:alpha/beta fold hydrolase [Streptomyces sp. NPDC048564]|uniref:alpha/beta fold hydrolase n=1 Tax=Streptomyces sp. NPDC048564 TaxID=3155760 RepID=UPI0034220AFB
MTSSTLPHELHGECARVFAVHGRLADRSAYSGVLPDLDRAEFTYALVDLRGYGDAKSAVGGYTTAEAALDLVELAGRLGWERFSVVGHSMGGAVGQRLLAVAPHRMRRLVEVSPAPASGLDLPPEQGEMFADAAHKPENRRVIIDITTGGHRPAARLDRMVTRSPAVSGQKAVRAWLDSWAREDFHTQVEGSPVPAFAVTGALDPALSADLLRRTWMTWYPRAELYELTAAGLRHSRLRSSGGTPIPMEETPLELIRVAEDFLRADGPHEGEQA